MDTPSRKLIILADGTGETAEKVVQAALTQFQELEVDIEVYTKVRSKFEIREVMEKAARQRAFVVYTVIDEEHRNYIKEQANELSVEVADLIGGLVVKVGLFFGAEPLNQAGIKQQLDADYFRRIEAVEFAVKADDGQSPQNLHRADMVLVGLSRTSKTPLSMYLAHKGFKVANVPLVPEIDPPKELFDIDQERVYALIIDLSSLVRVRYQRLRVLGLPPSAEYAARDNIARELRWCREFYARHPTWPVVDTSGRAVEETAAEMIRIMKERRERATQTEQASTLP